LIIQALHFVKIISLHNSESISIYLESLSDFLKIDPEKLQTSNNKKPAIDVDEEVRYDNRIKQISCEIFGNVLNIKNTSINVKNRLMSIVENYLIMIILNKPSYVMISAIE
jgi:hypothetical protein